MLRLKVGCQRDVETAVAGEQSGILAILLDSLFADDKHRDFRAVFRGVPNLLHVISGRIDGGRVDLAHSVLFCSRSRSTR